MSEIVHNEEDLNDIITDMENEDAPKEEDVELFQNLKIETPFKNKKSEKAKVQPVTSEPTVQNQVFSNTYTVTDPKLDEYTIIGTSTKIESNVTCGGNLELKGHIIGNIEIKGSLDVYGKVEGDIIAGELVVYEGASIKGNVSCKSNLSVLGGDIVGDVQAKNASVNSAIRGNMEISAELKLESTASVDGDISTGNIAVSTGAIINGRLSIKR